MERLNTYNRPIRKVVHVQRPQVGSVPLYGNNLFLKALKIEWLSWSNKAFHDNRSHSLNCRLYLQIAQTETILELGYRDKYEANLIYYIKE